MITTSQKDGMYAPPAALGPKRQQIWGTLPDSATWLSEDPTCAPSAGEQIDLVGDPRTRRVDEPEDWQLVTQRDFGHADDLLDGPGTPGARLDARVVRHHKSCSPVDQAATCDNAVGGQSSAIALASWPSSTKVYSSNSRSIRSRTKSLFATLPAWPPLVPWARGYGPAQH